MKMNNKYVASMALGMCLWVGPHHAAAQSLQATATVTIDGQGDWNYTLTNSEPSSSSNWLTDFYLPIFAPVTDVTAPNNWYVDTDDISYIDWSNIEPYPYPDDIAPGLSVSGFGFTSVGSSVSNQYGIGSWDHTNDVAGPDAMGTILVPSTPPVTSNAVPEPPSLPLLALGLTALVLQIMSARRRRMA